MQVCKIGVWVIFCLGQPQQIIGGYAVKLRQLDNSIVADVFEVLRFITAQRRLGEMCLLRELFHSLLVYPLLLLLLTAFLKLS